MKYEKWNDLQRYLMINPCDGRPWPLKELPEQYAVGLRKRLDDFREECRLNFDAQNSPELISMTASDLIDKLVDLRAHYFSKKGNKYIHKLSNKVIDKIENENHIKFLYIQLDFYGRAIKYLSKYLSSSNIEPDYPSFRVSDNMDVYKLEGVMNKMIKSDLIDKNTKPEDFIRIFKGRTPTKKINWTAGPGRLYYFINCINGKGVDFISHKWETTRNCFQLEGEDIKKDQLKGEKTPAYTKKLDQIIKIFNQTK